MKRAVLLAVVMISVTLSAFSQTGPTVPDALGRGLELFEEGQIERAIERFRASIDAPGSAYDGHALFWIGRGHLALGRVSEAADTFDVFLSTYGDHPYREETRYQRARVFYLNNQFEAAIQAFSRFLSDYPDSEFEANAIFWTAESLLSLGQLDAAEQLFREVTVKHPTSFRFEAAQYRLEILELKRRENELLTLLQWSHEEYLQALALYDQREQEYREALQSYRSRIADGGSEQVQSTITDLNTEIQTLEQQIQTQQEQINTLLAQLRQAGVEQEAPSEAAPEPSGTPSTADPELREALRQLREQALELQEALLEQQGDEE